MYGITILGIYINNLFLKNYLQHNVQSKVPVCATFKSSKCENFLWSTSNLEKRVKLKFMTCNKRFCCYSLFILGINIKSLCQMVTDLWTFVHICPLIWYSIPRTSDPICATCANEWTDRWTEGWIGGWTDGLMDEQVDRRTADVRLGDELCWLTSQQS